MKESYLEHLARRYERMGVKVDKDFQRELLYDEKKLMTALNHIVVDMARNLMPHVAAKIGIEKDVLEGRLSRIGVVERPGVNGSVSSPDDWETFQIAINLRLMMFLHKMIAFFASRSCVTSIWDQDVHPVEYPKLEIDDILPRIRRLMKAFWEGKVLQTPGLWLMHLNDSQLLIQSALVDRAECFVVAHEFGHIVIRICPRDVDEFDLGIQVIKTYISRMRAMSAHEKDIVARGWGEEIGADVIGLELSLMLAQDHDSRVLTYTAVELVFIIQNMLEAFYEKTMGTRPPMGLHPPTRWRLDILRTLVGEYNPPLFELGNAEGYERIADHILSGV